MMHSAKVVYLVLAASVGLAVSNTDASPRSLIEDAIQKALRSMFDPLDPIYLPFFPTVGYNPYDGIDFSLSLTDINMTGLASVMVSNFTEPPRSGGPGQLDLIFPKLLLYAGEYSAGGHISNMPFTGESFLSVSFEDMTVNIGMEFSKYVIPINVCVVPGSITWTIEIFKPIIYFDQLNPGTDQGELVNTIFGAFVPDIVDYMAQILNTPNGALNTIVNNLIVSSINAKLCRS